MGLINDFRNFRRVVSEAEEQRKVGQLATQFKQFTVYAPVFSTFQGGLYEMDLTRSAIHTIANHASKANPIVAGSKYREFEKVLQHFPNNLMTNQQFIAKLVAILMAENTAFIIPLYEDRTAGKIIGLYPVSSLESNIFGVNGKEYLKYTVQRGYEKKTEVIEFNRVGVCRNHYYRDDYYGSANNALDSTMELINTQNQGIIEGVKQSASIRFMMKLAATIAKPEGFTAERDRMAVANLQSGNNNGIFIYDNKYSEAKQIESKPFIVDADQAAYIQKNVYNYFGVSEKVLQNNFSEEEWNAFYEGKIEPILIQISEVISRMLFNEQDFKQGSMVIYESSRLQYASNTTKLAIVTSLVDRGLITPNQGLKIFNLPEVDDGNVRYIRREYVEVSKLGETSEDEKDTQNDE